MSLRLLSAFVLPVMCNPYFIYVIGDDSGPKYLAKTSPMDKEAESLGDRIQANLGVNIYDSSHLPADADSLFQAPCNRLRVHNQEVVIPGSGIYKITESAEFQKVDF